MREKLYRLLNRVYGLLMGAAFFGGIVPLPFFLVSIAIGGSTGEGMTVFFYEKYYPWVIALAAIAVMVGVIAMYLGKVESLSVKRVNAGKKGK